ncbi:MAG: hypothetical protein IKD31_00455 [Clostridia bacterium]|nr:hypothetical protein [Clostridia bacterium]
MSRKTRFIVAICLVAQSFTSLVLSFVYANRKKDLSKIFLGFGILGGLGGAYLLYNEYQDAKNEKLAYEGADWCSDDCDCCEENFFEDENADDINFTIEDEAEAPAEDAEAAEADSISF